MYARWKLDETTGTAVVDASGNGNAGVATAAGWTQNAKVYRSWVKGAFDTAGGTKHISVTGPLYGYSTTFQFKAWVRRNAGGAGVIWSDRPMGGGTGLRVKVNSSGVVDVSYYSGDGIEHTQTYILTVPELTWTQIVWRLNSSYHGELFINAFKDTVYTTDTNADGGQTQGDGKIGVDYDGVTDPFGGIIDDMDFDDPQTDGAIAAQYAAEAAVPAYKWKTQASETQWRFTAAAILQINQEYENPRNSGAAVDKIVQGQSIIQKGTTYNGTAAGGTAPGIPVDLMAVPVSQTALDLSCDFVATAKTIKWYECDNVAGDNPVLISPVFQGGMVWRISGLLADSTHYYKAKASNDTGDSGFSAVVTGSTLLIIPEFIGTAAQSEIEASATQSGLTGNSHQVH
jgi:hypothetical protein